MSPLVLKELDGRVGELETNKFNLMFLVAWNLYSEEASYVCL